jgi:putative redox protein
VALVAYLGGLRCRSVHEESGAVVTTDAPKDHLGLGESFSPSDLLAVSLGSCILSMMGTVALAMDVDINGATAAVEKAMANAPRRIAKLSVAIRVPKDLTGDQIRRLEQAAHACPVHKCLDPAMETPITFTWGKTP